MVRTAATLRHHHLRVRSGQIGELLTGLLIGDDGALRHEEHHVFASGAVLVVAASGLPVRGAPVGLPVVVDQRGQARIDPEDDRPAVPAVAAVRPAQRLELLPVDGGAAVAAVAAVRVQGDPVDEARDRHGLSLLPTAGGLLPVSRVNRRNWH